MTVFNLLFSCDSFFKTIYIYDTKSGYRVGDPAATYERVSEIPDCIALNDVRAYRINFELQSIHILY